jgi:uncharacterized protein (TIGR02271 family)
MFHEKVVAIYDTEAKANAAIETLKLAGYSTANVSLIRDEGEAEKAGLHEPGVWRRLFGRDLDPNDAAVFGRSIKEGSAIVAVRATETEAPKVMSLLDSHQPLNIRDRAEAYGLAAAASLARNVTTPAKLNSEEVVRLAEEQLNVGKQMVESGHTRIRRYLVEKPVEANVTLHEEHAEVIRRAITDPAYVKDIDWSDKTIDVTETDEEAVVNKTARVTEEVVIRRQGSDHTQTVHATVRRQQIDVEQVPVGAGTKKSA